MNKDSLSLTNAISYEIIDACVSVEQALTNYNNKQMTLCENGAPYDECYCIDTTNIDEFMCNEYDEIIRILSNDEIVEESFKDVISAIVNGIKRAIRWIVTSFKRLLGKVFGNKKKAKKTANQIAAEIIKTTVQESGDDTSKYYKQKIINIRFKDEKNQLREIPVTFFDKKLNIGIDGNGYIIHPKGIGKLDSVNMGVGGNQLASEFKENVISELYMFMTNNHIRNIIMDFITNANNTDDTQNLNTSEIESILYKLKSVNFTADIKLDSIILQNWIKILNEFGFIISEIDPIRIGSDFKNGNIKSIFHDIKYLMLNMTIAVNILSKELTGLFYVDTKYENAIDNLEDLSRFVNGMIQAGIPSSYVGYNTWFVMNDKFHDNDVFIDLDDISKTEPHWGHSRITFYPIDYNLQTKVLKIALNSLGIAGNSREMYITNTYKQLPYKTDDGVPFVEFFAKTETISRNKCIVIAERVVPEYNKKEADELAYTINMISSKLKGRLNVEDIHGGNVGYADTKYGKLWKVLDYGDTVIS